MCEPCWITNVFLVDSAPSSMSEYFSLVKCSLHVGVFHLWESRLRLLNAVLVF